MEHEDAEQIWVEQEFIIYNLGTTEVSSIEYVNGNTEIRVHLTDEAIERIQEEGNWLGGEEDYLYQGIDYDDVQAEIALIEDQDTIDKSELDARYEAYLHQGFNV